MFRNTQRHNVSLRHPTYSIYCRIVNSVKADGCVHITESVGSRRELGLVANSCTHRRRRRDATKQFRRVGVGGVYWALNLPIHVSACILDSSTYDARPSPSCLAYVEH